MKNSFLKEYIRLLDPKIGEIWYTEYCGKMRLALLLKEEFNKSGGSKWLAFDLENGTIDYIIPWSHLPECRWKKFA